MVATTRARRTWPFAASLLLATGTRLPAQTRLSGGTIDGVVSDTTFAPLASATVSVLGSAIRVVTGDNGRFRIRDLPPGSYVVVVHRIGYAPISSAIHIAEGDTLRPSFTLRQVATALDTLVVSERSAGSRLSEFEARRRLGFGHFITDAEIQKRNVVYVADLIRTIPSVAIEDRRLFTQVAVNTRSGCPFRVFLDGVALPQSTNLADLPGPREVAGIEVYLGPATVPTMYAGSTNGCGAIFVWTKTG